MARKQPPYFRIYLEDATLFSRLPDKVAGELFKAVCNVFLTGERMEYDDPYKDAIYAGLVDKLELNLAAYVATCEKNKNNRKGRRHDDTAGT